MRAHSSIFTRILAVILLFAYPIITQAGDNDSKKKSPSDIGCNFGPTGKWYLDLLASPDYALRSLASSESALNDHISVRESSESYAGAFTTGLRISYVTVGGISFRTGLMFNQIIEKIDFTNTVLSTDLPEWDTFPTAVEGQRRRVNYNRYSHVDIPVIVGVEMGKGPWRLNINGGAYINLLAKQKGQMIDQGAIDPTNIDLLDFTSDLDQGNSFAAFKDNVGVSYYAGVAATYELNRDMQFVIEPHFRHFQNPHNTSVYNVDQSYQTIGVFFGIRRVL